MANVKPTITAEELAALRAISEPAAQLQYRALCTEQHPSLLFIYDNLRLNNSPEHAYKMVCLLDQSFSSKGIREELPYGTNKSVNSDPGAFNPGGRHLRLEPDGNIAVSKDHFNSYSPRHLHASGEEILAQKLRYA